MYIVSFLSSYIKFSTKQLYYFALDPTEYNSQQLREHPSLWKGATRRREILWLSSIGVSWWAASQNYLLCIDWGMTFLGTTLWWTGRTQSPPSTVPSTFSSYPFWVLTDILALPSLRRPAREAKRKGYWLDRENRRQFFLAIAAEKGFDPSDWLNWRQVTIKHIKEKKVPPICWHSLLIR